MSLSTRYRPDIDGLRGVAIISVLLYHLDVKPFSGGFVGVDVFFVISGFLITSFIFPEIIAGRFSFVAFYERRIRRLIPAQLAVLLFTSVMAVLLLLPSDLVEYAKSVVATSLFSANFFFWWGTDYFQGPSALKPLLHSWSLSVEEQFYIAFPIFLLLTFRFAPRRMLVVPVVTVGIASFASFVLAGVALGSFAAAAYELASAPESAFYLPYYRAWELMIGAFLSINSVSSTASKVVRNTLGLLGLLLIGYGIFGFSRGSPFPGFRALLPTIGAALVIYSGINGGSFVNRLLCFRPLVFIGLISYSLYLWHWPLVVFAKYYLVRELHTFEKSEIFVGSVVLAVISWRFIERPFRGRGHLLGTRILYAGAAAGAALFVGFGLWAAHEKGLPGRFPADIVDIAQTRTVALATRDKRCVRRPIEGVDGFGCAIGPNEGGAPSFLLWGDSHALVTVAALDQLAKVSGRTGMFLGKASCAPLLGLERHDLLDSACISTNAAIASYLAHNKSIRTVVLAARWAQVANGVGYGEDELMRINPKKISPEAISGNAAKFREGLERTIEFLRGQKLEVVVLTQVPEVGWNVPSVLARDLLFGHDHPKGPSKEAYIKRQRIVTDTLRELSLRYRFRIVDVSSAFCPGQTCLVAWNGKPLYLDGDHISLHGAELLTKVLQGVL